MDSANILTARNPHQAFEAFNLTFSELCEACAELHQQALVLTQELALVKGELRRQFEAKEALREALQRQERLAAMGKFAAAGAAMDMKSLERAHIEETLLAVNGSRKLALQRLGISERSLRYKLRQYRLEGGLA